MKYKVWKFFLMSLMLLGFTTSAFAANTFVVSEFDTDAAAGIQPILLQNVAPGKAVVVGAFSVTTPAIETLKSLRVKGAGFTIADADVDSLFIYLDANQNGTFEPSVDVLQVAANDAQKSTWVASAADVTFALANPVDFAANAVKSYLVVAKVAEVGSDQATYDGKAFKTIFNVLDIENQATAGPVTATNGAAVAVKASHLRFSTDGYKTNVAAANDEVALTGTLLEAVDDFGNLDLQFAENVKLSAENFTTGQGYNTLTATNGDGDDLVADGVVMAGGKLDVDTAALAGLKVKSIKVTSPAGPVTLVAKSATSHIEGSTTFSNTPYTDDVPVVETTRGIEVYDVDHDGHIDHMTIFFNKPVNPAGATQFTVGSGYTIVGAAVSNFDAGGVGIRNAGEYGVTVTLAEKAAYDTNVKPQLSYTGTNVMLSANSAKPVAAFGTSQAVEVDKARPVLISALTKDAGIGAGTASNGILDGIVFTFSEPVRNVTAGANIADTDAYVGLAIPSSYGFAFNQGNGTISGNTVTIPVSETTINTGITPDITYNEGYRAARITDYASSAIGVSSIDTYNPFFANLDYYAMAPADADPVIITTDDADMVVHSVETLDTSTYDADGDWVSDVPDGRIDHMRVTFSEDLNGNASFKGVSFVSPTAAFASLDNKNGTYLPSGVEVSGPTALFEIDQVTTAGVYDTEATPTFSYDNTVDDSNLMDSAGNEIGSYGSGDLTAPNTIDTAAPVVVAIITGDAFADTTYAGASNFEKDVPDGRIDTVKLVFSEKVQTGEGAANGGSALDHAINQFDVHHALAGAVDYQVKFATTAVYGKPEWKNEGTGDTKTTITIHFQEMASSTAGMIHGGDTGLGVTMLYTPHATANYNIKDFADDPNVFVNPAPANWPAFTDGAAPFIVDSVLGETYTHVNVATYDKKANLINATGDHILDDPAYGDGYLEGFKLQFTEDVYYTGAALGQFTTTAQNGGVIKFSEAGSAFVNAAFAPATAVGTADDVIYLTGKRTTQGTPDTGTTPVLTYTKNDDNLKVRDAAGNLLATFENRPSVDGAAPVVVGVNGDTAAANKMNFTFSEPVFAHNVDGDNISFNAASIGGSTLFGYENLSAGVGASAFTSASVTQVSANVLQATMNAALTVADIASDLVWVKSASIFDDADAADASLDDNATVSSVAGGSIKIWIMDDVVAPWIVGIKTIDWNGNGKIDHLRVQLSEPITDSTIKGFVSNNAMSNDVSATWKLSGYTGVAKWNFFDGHNTDAGKVSKAAAIAAGKPAFNDNAANDNVLYLELDEEAVPANAATGVGSTGFKPTVTWGTGADAETMGDARPNMLDTASTKDDATNGTVTDFVAPVIVGATVNGSAVTVLFSEPLKNTGDVSVTTDFVFGKVGTLGDEGKIYGISWPNTSTVVLTMKPGYTFAAGTAYGVQLANADAKDAADNTALPKDFDLTGRFLGSMFNEQSPVAPTQYAPKANTVGVFAISNLTVLANNSTSPIDGSTIAAGSTVTLKWTASNIENVAVYQSFNSGVTYEMVPGSQVAASAGSTTWSAKMGVTNVKVQAVGGSAAISFAYNVVFDGNTIGSSIGAPSALSVYDVPNDNGGFAYAQFTKSADHLTAVNSYQFYREVTVVDSTKAWVLWATVAAGTPDADGKLTVIIPTIWNDNSNWKVAASTGKLLSEGVVAAKVAADAIPVAEVVYNAGAAKVAAVQNVSTFSDVATGASIDNIAPSALTSATAADNDGAGTGVVVSWVAPADHGIVASYTLNGVTNYIYGVDSYEVYRKAAGTQEFVLAGTAGSGSTSFTDAVADGATIYSYLVKAVDSAHSVETVVPGRVMAGNGTSDFNADGAVSLGDLVLLGNMWGLKNTSSDFVANFDLNHDGQISVGDLVLLGGAWTSTSAKVAKAAGEVPMSNIAFQMVSSVNESNKMYYVSINTKDAASINAVSFSLKYDASKFEFVSDSVTGLGDIPLVKADQAGIIDIASLYQNEKFNGTVTLGFKAKDAKSDMNVEMVNAEVALNGVVSSAKNAETVMLKALPQTYALSQNFPNPFNPTTTIEYSIPTTGNVSLVIYNVAGQKIRTLVNGNQSANYYKVIWDGKNDNGMTVGTGTYFYKLVSGNYSKIVKMTLMK